MPEVKWVNSWYAGNPKTLHIADLSKPVLTLDELEAWLKENVDATAPNGLHMCIDDLLAQVQAMKEKP